MMLSELYETNKSSFNQCFIEFRTTLLERNNVVRKSDHSGIGRYGTEGTIAITAEASEESSSGKRSISTP